MSEIEVIANRYTVDDNEVPVSWVSYDFTDSVAGIPSEDIREVMLDSGVMFVAAAEPKIRVSHLLDRDLQGLSAVHEELCQNQHVAACSEVEGMVIDSVEDPELRASFINMRYRMFGALVTMYESNVEFTETHQMLGERREV